VKIFERDIIVKKSNLTYMEKIMLSSQQISEQMKAILNIWKKAINPSSKTKIHVVHTSRKVHLLKSIGQVIKAC